MDYAEYKSLYNGLNGPKDVEKYISDGYDVHGIDVKLFGHP